jgi:hypothetical protein
MNKIYKLVWSAALGQFVVTSEVANSRGKSGGRQGGATATVLQSWLFDKPLTLLYSATLVAVMAYSSPADADVLFNSSVIGSGDTICTNINDTTGATKFIGEWISVRCAQYRTSATNDANFYKTLVTGRSALALGGELFVNGGKIGLADYEGGTYGMRIGSVATVDAAIGLDAIAIGTAQTTANDGATSTPTTASAARTIAIGSAASSTAADALALGTTATASATNAIAIGTQSRADAAEAVAIGTNAVATGGRAVSIGSGNVANGNGAVAIGDPNTATGSGAIAQGLDNTATGNGAVAMGNTNMVGGGGQAVGVAGTAAQGAVGIGYQPQRHRAGPDRQRHQHLRRGHRRTGSRHRRERRGHGPGRERHHAGQSGAGVECRRRRQCGRRGAGRKLVHHGGGRHHRRHHRRRCLYLCR